MNRTCEGLIGLVSQLVQVTPIYHMSSDQNPGFVGYTGYEILPSYIGIIIGHCKDSYKPTTVDNKDLYYKDPHEH